MKRLLPITKVILATLWEVGKITTKSFFPPQYAKKYGYSSLYKHQYVNSLYHLKRRGVVRVDGEIFRISPKGEKEAFFAYLDSESKTYSPKWPLKWDGKWRIIFFDVPEKKRYYRDYLRTILKTVGFKEFQKSIWIYPYPVPKFIKDMLFEENIKQYTRFVTTNAIEYDKDLRKKFNL